MRKESHYLLSTVFEHGFCRSLVTVPVDGLGSFCSLVEIFVLADYLKISHLLYIC